MDDSVYELMRLQAEKSHEVYSDLQKKHPDLPFQTLIVMGNDLLSKKTADYLVTEKKLSAEEAGQFVGSYARVEWYLEHLSQLPRNWLIDSFPTEWSNGDPDDTDPKYLEVWKRAFKMNKHKILRDELAEVEFQPDLILKVYRGQMRETDPLGISWTLSYHVAKKFASGASYRVSMNGVVISRYFKFRNVIAYITGRNEQEIICDPTELRRTHEELR